MNILKIGLVPSPDLPEKIISRIIDELHQDFKNHIDSNIDWQFETQVDVSTGAAEYVNECIDNAVKMKHKRNWDYAICLTDLPSFSKNKVVIADISTDRNAALISLPSLGMFPLKRRVRKALISIVESMYAYNKDKKPDKLPFTLNWLFFLPKIKQVIPQDNNHTDIRYILQSRLIGWLRVLSGMTMANRPWTALTSFKKILTLAFATGTYISIFSVPWQLSVAYTPYRFITLMLLSMVGMVIWTIFAHNLWENASSKSQGQYRRLYNVTTVMTLTVITIINYIVLYALFMMSVSLFVPEGIFEAWTKVESGNSLGNFMRLAWLITSLGLLAGAVGATAEKEEKIRLITYSYRQLNRYYEIEQQGEEEAEEEGYTKEEILNTYSGTQQTHREGDEQ